MATGCGYTYQQIGEMLLPQAYEIFEHWKRSPPVHRLAAWTAGFKPPKANVSAGARTSGNVPNVMSAEQLMAIRAQVKAGKRYG